MSHSLQRLTRNEFRIQRDMLLSLLFMYKCSHDLKTESLSVQGMCSKANDNYNISKCVRASAESEFRKEFNFDAKKKSVAFLDGRLAKQKIAVRRHGIFRAAGCQV